MCVCVHVRAGFDFFLLGQNTCQVTNAKLLFDKTFIFTMQQIRLHLTKLKIYYHGGTKPHVLWATWALLLEVLGSSLVLYQYTDLTEPQPDAHKYIPLFLPLCGCQLGRGSGFVLGVLSISQPEPHFHVAHKRAVLASWNAYVFPLVVVCHGGDPLKAAQLDSSVYIMETCLSRRPRINQLAAPHREL